MQNLGGVVADADEDAPIPKRRCWQCPPKSRRGSFYAAVRSATSAAALSNVQLRGLFMMRHHEGLASIRTTEVTFARRSSESLHLKAWL